LSALIVRFCGMERALQGRTKGRSGSLSADQADAGFEREVVGGFRQHLKAAQGQPVGRKRRRKHLIADNPIACGNSSDELTKTAKTPDRPRLQ
jgi:hypothetical protein